mmetsp:Transcript_16218/g.32900  ORF Transcript_16218/g.32900 Transcript_16218/m.32900 type:complete len:228 (-) Transcript_16218:442-1125(-)
MLSSTAETSAELSRTLFARIATDLDSSLKHGPKSIFFIISGIWETGPFKTQGKIARRAWYLQNSSASGEIGSLILLSSRTIRPSGLSLLPYTRSRFSLIALFRARPRTRHSLFHFFLKSSSQFSGKCSDSCRSHDAFKTTLRISSIVAFPFKHQPDWNLGRSHFAINESIALMIGINQVLSIPSTLSASRSTNPGRCTQPGTHRAIKSLAPTAQTLVDEEGASHFCQ